MYLNQLMSFSAVAAPALMALSQTKELSQLLEKFWGLLDVISLPVEAGPRSQSGCISESLEWVQPQVGDAGGSSMAVSAECLLTCLWLA